MARETDVPRTMLLELLKEHALKRGDFTLKSGRKSNFLINCKDVVLTADGHYFVGRVMLETLQTAGCKAVAGVELGGCPIASAIAMASSVTDKPINAVYVRKSPKDHGSKNLLEGEAFVKRTDPIVVVEDVTTTGSSALDAVIQLWKYGYSVMGVATLVDRLEGGRENIVSKNLTFWSVFDRNDFLPSGE